MRPPVLPSGNLGKQPHSRLIALGFNEAAGFTQRKLGTGLYGSRINRASMRPPVLPSGNMS